VERASVEISGPLCLARKPLNRAKSNTEEGSSFLPIIDCTAQATDQQRNNIACRRKCFSYHTIALINKQNEALIDKRKTLPWIATTTANKNEVIFDDQNGGPKSNACNEAEHQCSRKI
jgi:hypothetical protein